MSLCWSLMVELSKRIQYRRNRKRFWLIAAMHIGFPVPPMDQTLAVLSLEPFVTPKNSKTPMRPQTSVSFVSYVNPDLIV